MRVLLALSILKILNSVLLFSHFFLWPFPKRKKIKTICIHRVGQVGDSISIIPAIEAIRNTYPSAKITFLTSPGKKGMPGAQELLSGSDWVDNIWVYYSEDLKSFGKTLQLARQLRSEKFDAWIQLPQDLTTFRTEIRNMIFAKIVGVRWATGYCIRTIRLFAHAQSRSINFVQETKWQLHYLKKNGIKSNDVKFPLPISCEDKKVVSGYIDSHKLDKPLLAIAPGGKRLSNRWPLRRFAEIGTRWLDYGGQVVILGSEGERKLGGEIEKICNKRVINLCGMTTLMQAAELLRHCQLNLSNDSGLMHLSAAVGTPCVVPFSARDFPGKWIPWGDQHEIIRKNTSCSPCLSEECQNDNDCLEQITVDEIWQAVQRVAKGDSGEIGK